MRCTLGLDENWELVVGYAARTLDPRTRASFELHLKCCQACSETVAVQQAVWDALDESPALSVSRDFDGMLQSRIAHQEAGWRQRKFLDQIRHAAVPVAAAGAVFGVALWLNHPQRMQVVVPAPPASAMEAAPQQSSPQQDPQLDKLEHALDDMDMLGKLSSGAEPERASATKPI